MQSIGAFEAKTHFSALLDQVAKGEQIIITKHGHPVAKLISIKATDKSRIRDTILKLKEFSKSNTLNGLDWKTLRDEGRK